MVKVETVHFNSRAIKLAADIRYPDGFDKSKKYAALVIAHPINGCKEQTSGSVYGQQLAENGFITLAFDAGYQASSGGEPRYVEDPALRVNDFTSAADYLVTLPFVDENRIGVVGICGGGGYAANSALTEKRFRAVGLVVPVNYGRIMREGDSSPDNIHKNLKLLADQRTKEARSRANGKDDALIVPYVPFKNQEEREKAGVHDIEMKEAIDYYMTPRAQKPDSVNKLRFTSAGPMFSFDAFHMAEVLFTQPLHVVIAGVPGVFGSYRDGQEIYYKARTTDKSLQILPNLCHFDLYDKPEATSQSIPALVKFFEKHLN